MIDTTKVCPSCKVEKTLSSFPKDKSKSSGYASRCKSCRALNHKEYRNNCKILKKAAIKEKFCPGCNNIKPVAEYDKYSGSKIGLSSHCKQCRSERAKASNANAEYRKKYYSRNRLRISDRNKLNRVLNSRDANAPCRKYYLNNKETELAKNKYYRETNKHIFACHSAKRRAVKALATPAWADLKAIEKIYEQAAEATKATGVKFEVDHIDPLISDKICGLHVLENLQIITSMQNKSKCNRFNPYRVDSSGEIHYFNSSDSTSLSLVESDRVHLFHRGAISSIFDSTACT